MPKAPLKVILINPKFKDIATCLPMGLAYIAAYAKNQGFNEIEAIDANATMVSSSGLIEEVLNRRPYLVGISATTATINQAWDISQKIKEKDNSVKILLGGAHPSTLPEESLNKEFIDFVIRGEGEEAFSDLLKALKGSKELSQIDGLSYKKNSQIVNNPPREFIRNLDDVPFPERSIFPFPHKYKSPVMRKSAYAAILTSRGCPGTCIFCNKSIFKYNFRPRSPENVVDEIEYLRRNYGIEEFHFIDDCFSWDIERAERICQEILSRNLKIFWAATNGTRVDRITKDLLKKMKESGCYRLSFGVESGSPEILQNIKKGIDLEKIKWVLESSKKEGIVTIAFFMIGNYGDNPETIDQTIKFAKGLDIDFAQFSFATPYPGTLFYEKVEKEGRFLTRNWSDFGIYKRPVFEMNGLSADLMRRMHKKAYRSFYLRPRQLKKLLVQFLKRNK